MEGFVASSCHIPSHDKSHGSLFQDLYAWQITLSSYASSLVAKKALPRSLARTANGVSRLENSHSSAALEARSRNYAHDTRRSVRLRAERSLMRRTFPRYGAEDHN